jgi:hypothetical protein
MAYIVDLTLVMDHLFFDTLPLSPPRILSLDQINMAYDCYKMSGLAQVHSQIRQYVQKSTFAQIVASNNAQQKVIDIIKTRGAAQNQS